MRALSAAVDLMLEAGRLRDRITIRRLTDVPDGKGGYDRGWSTVAERVSAEVLSQNGREAVIGAALQGISTYRITIRYRGDIRTNDQIVWDGGDELNIRSAARDPRDREALIILADTESPQNAEV